MGEVDMVGEIVGSPVPVGRIDGMSLSVGIIDGLCDIGNVGSPPDDG